MVSVLVEGSLASQARLQGVTKASAYHLAGVKLHRRADIITTAASWNKMHT